MLKSVDPNNQAFEWKKQMFIVLELLPWKLSVEEATLLIGQKRNASIVLIGHSLKGKGNLMGLVNPRLGLDFNKEEIMVMINIALLCTNVSPAVRPAMPSVVNMLEGRIAVCDDLKLKEMISLRPRKEHGFSSGVASYSY
ncbi:probable LRR receptor-like serine/threonine-protein kinase At1g07650 [Vitis riparia]|uniref:probable LRR receptor-like serine/threonine-protein kinase At1g07650 n=1 Tax=Vitis riparia TaxID=96939 RepID=UPI00155A75E2|nr:probable LRR receptor-like serine/threonine-protein kinase At1g07650 [Vitis riparia]XP_034696288.1 probable LRR receptor-like serine/threonine-protein kinase At1g07650 [Vitis riparia]XP_034696289.1 probable LRR receptor-like serine/threonine-protein kinase At1g07650 [Vitis riparia]XP_034696292.1 probable LRR receptor-like serine/threonine-protein kinase At1g07650 [Vitis riparia]XP_034696293.1 probable LRR receptor-like serine/threonine-protein kinase At1g07650 [Vitis riparia]XP_034696294.1 